MQFNDHFRLQGKHAFLSASKYSWIRYDDEKIYNTFFTALQAARGTRLHEFAKMAIELGQKQPKTSQTLNMFVNDALGLHMSPEQILYVSDNCFGTADAISFGPSAENRGRMLLRIHDLKTGTSKTNVNQLEIYAAMFCLEYGYSPFEIDMELRIYQNDERMIFIPDPEDIQNIMDKIIRFDQIIENAKMEGAL